MSTRTQRISELAPTSSRVALTETTKEVTLKKPKGFGFYLLWFVIVALVAWFILYLWKPSWVQKTGVPGELDGGKVLTWSLIFALIVTLIVWLFQIMT
jgi:hypothetical protein